MVSPMARTKRNNMILKYLPSIFFFIIQSIIYKQMASRIRAIILRDNESILESEEENTMTNGAMIRNVIAHFKNRYPGIFNSLNIFI